ncbi:MAG: SDR family NAD(P)-dependent oxidoreductase [Acetobacteraceae bacterium]|nr:SDR family NAD(P)-dependent oxidoreductase [Acetobacteraceae bacterium]
MSETEKRVAVVTGATGGIGRWIARGLAEAGLHVVLIGRNADRAESAAQWIAQGAPGASTETRLADLSSLRATRTVGSAIATSHPRIAVLVNNAGMFSARRQVTAEGREAVLAVNHLTPYVLTDALDDALRAGAPSRIVNVGSSKSDRARIDPNNLELTRGWGLSRAYGQSKLALMMSTFARAERLRGSGVVANVVHPGLVATGLVREGGVIGAAWRIMKLYARTEEQGAATPLHVALSPDWATVTGAYVKDRVAVAPNPRALDSALASAVESSTRGLLAQVFGAG